MNINLFKKYYETLTAHKIYVLLHNALIDIANAPSETWQYRFGRTEHVCCQRHTVDKAKQAMRAWKELADDYKQIEKINKIDESFTLNEDEVKSKINQWKNEFNQSKFATMKEAIIEISKSRPYRFQWGLFDAEYRCVNEETIDIAKNAINRMNKYI